MRFQRRVFGGGREGFNPGGWQPMPWQGREEQPKDFETIRQKPLFAERRNAAGLFLRGQMDHATALKVLDDLNPDLFPAAFSLFQTQSSPQESIEAAKQFIVDGTIPAKISADTPVEQFAWGVALAAASHEAPDLQQQPIWKAVEHAAALNHERNTLRSIAMGNVRNSRLSVRWGPPPSGYPDIGFYYDHVNNVVNVDMVWSLIMGLEHARAPMMHEIGHGELSVSFSPKMDALFKRIDALTEKQHSGAQLSEDEYKELIESRIEWDLRNRVYQEAENSTVNHFATGNGHQYGQDIGYSLNTVEMVPPSPADLVGSNRAEWEQAFLNVTQAVRLLFFQNNGLFLDNPEEWKKFDVDVKAIDQIAGTEGAAIGYSDLRQRILGADGIQYRQPGQFDRMMGASTFAAMAEMNSYERGLLVDDLFDTYCSGFLADARAAMAQHMSEQQEFEQLQNMLNQMLEQAMRERQEARRQQQQKQQAESQKGSGDGKQDAKADSDSSNQDASDNNSSGGQQPQDDKPQQKDGQGLDGKSEQANKQSQNGEVGGGSDGHNQPGEDGQTQDQGGGKDAKPGQQGGQGQPGEPQGQTGQPGGAGGQNQPSQQPQAGGGGGNNQGQGQPLGAGQDAPPSAGDLTRQIMQEIFKNLAEKIGLENGEAPAVDRPPETPRKEFEIDPNVKDLGNDIIPPDIIPEVMQLIEGNLGGGNIGYGGLARDAKEIDVTGGELNDYQKIIQPHKATILEVKRLLADLEKRRYQRGKEPASTYELLPDGGEFSRFDPDRQQDLMRKIALQQGFDVEDLKRFSEDNPTKKIVVPNSYVILIDTSGSMQGEPFDHAVAAAAVLFEATRGNRNAQTYIVAMGEPTPTVIAKPKDNPIEVARRIAAIEKNVRGCKDHLTPALTKSIQLFADNNRHSGALTGMVHVIVCTDGGHNDIREAVPFLQNVIGKCKNITVDYCLIGEQTTEIDKIPATLEPRAEKRFDIRHCTGQGQIRNALIDLVRGRLKMPIEEAVKIGDQRKQFRAAGLELK